MEKGDIGYRWVVATDMGQGRSFTVEGNFKIDTSVEAMNSEVDKVIAVAKRQQARMILPNIKAEIQKYEAVCGAAETDLKNYDELKGKITLTAHDRTHRESMVNQITATRKRVEELKADLVETEKDAE